jgi:tRNA (Thr-GGU) A37 N-methylase
MQRLKKALRHLRAIQHVTILIVAGSANKHRPRRVMHKRQKRRISAL